MTWIDTLWGCCWVVAVSLLAACGKDDAVQDKSFDAAFVAEEADRGNFEPLKELSKACHGEVLKYGRRRSACGALDRAGKLQQPIGTRF